MHHDPHNQARRTLRDYPLSQDYTDLAELIKTQAVLCVCDTRGNQPTRRAGLAYGIHEADGNVLFVFKGITGSLFWSSNLKEFITLCKQYHVEFLPPQPTTELVADPYPHSSALAQFFMWIGVTLCALAAVTILLIALSRISQP